MDAGYDETTNPFANVSEEYVKKKEDLLKKQNAKKRSARARQVQKVKTGIIFLKKIVGNITMSYSLIFSISHSITELSEKNIPFNENLAISKH